VPAAVDEFSEKDFAPAEEFSPADFAVIPSAQDQAKMAQAPGTSRADIYQGPYGGGPAYLPQQMEEARTVMQAPTAAIQGAVGLAGKGVTALANIPTTISNIGKEPGEVGYTTPIQDLPRPQFPRTSEEDIAGAPPWLQNIAGAGNIISGAAQQMLPPFAPPEVGLTLPLLGGEGGVNRVVAGALGAEQLASIPEQLQQASQTIQDPNASRMQKIEYLGRPGVSALFGGLMTRSAIGKEPYARSQQEAAEVHGNLQSSSGPGAEQVPAQEGGTGVQPQAQEVAKRAQLLLTLNQRIAELENHPDVTGKKLVSMNPDGSPVFEENIIDQSKVHQLEQLKALAEQLKPKAPMEMEVSEQERYDQQERQGMMEGGAKTGEIIHHDESPMLGHHEEAIQGALDSNIERGLSGKLRVLPPDESQDAPVFKANLDTGEIEMNNVKFKVDTLDMTPEQLREYVDTLVAEEGFHLSTPRDVAKTFFESMSPLQQALEKKTYAYKKNVSPEYLANPTLMGFEAIRRRMQRLSGLTTSEVASAVGREKWTQRSIDLMTRALDAWHRVIRSEGSKVQRRILSDMTTKLNAAREAGGMPKWEPGEEAGGEQPFSPSRDKGPPEEPQERKRRNINYAGPGIIGNVMNGAVNARQTPNLLKAHWEFRGISEGTKRWRYDPDSNTVTWVWKPTSETMDLVDSHLAKSGIYPQRHESLLTGYKADAPYRVDGTDTEHLKSDQPFAPSRAGSTSHDDLSKMDDETAYKFFKDLRAAGIAPQYDSVLAGMKLDKGSLPQLQDLLDKSSKDWQESFKKGDQTGQEANFGKMVWYAGAIEGAKREGPNYRGVIQRQQQPEAPSREEGGFKKWMERFRAVAKERGEILYGSDKFPEPRTLTPEESQRVEQLNKELTELHSSPNFKAYQSLFGIPDQMGRREGFPGIGPGVGPQAPSRKKGPSEDQPEMFPGMTAMGVPGQEPEARPAATELGATPFKETSHKALEEDAISHLKTAAEPSFQDWSKTVDESFRNKGGGKTDASQLKDAWATAVTKHYSTAPGAEVEDALKKLNLGPRVSTAGVPSKEWQATLGKYGVKEPAGKGMRVSLPMNVSIADPLMEFPAVANQTAIPDAEAQRKLMAADFRRKAQAAEDFLKSVPNATYGTKLKLNRLAAANRARADIVESGGNLERVEQEGVPAEARELKGIVTRRQRQRNTAVRQIVQKLLEQTEGGEETWNRTEIDNTDLDFGGKSKQPAFSDIGKELLDRTQVLGDLLTEDSGSNRTGKNAPPVSVTKRVTALVNPRTGDVYLVSTYKDGRRGAVLQDPQRKAGATLKDVMRVYRPFASLLLKSPVKDFVMKFEDMEDFNSRIGNEARVGVEATAGEYEMGQPQEFTPEDFGPEHYEEMAAEPAEGVTETVEGLPSTKAKEGQVGGIVGPHASEGMALVAPKPLSLRAPLTDNEVNSVFEDFTYEVGDADKPEKMKQWAEGIMDAFKANDMTPRQRTAFLALAKSANHFLREDSKLTDERAWEKALDYYYDTLANKPKTAKTVAETVGRFTPSTVEGRLETLARATRKPLARPTRPGETPPAVLEPETVQPGTLPEEQIPPTGRPDVPPKARYKVGERRTTSLQHPPEPQEVPKELGEGIERALSPRPVEMREREFPFSYGQESPQAPSRIKDAKARVQEDAQRKKAQLSALATRHGTKEEGYALRDGLESNAREEAHLSGRHVLVESFAGVETGKKPTAEQRARAEQVRKSVQAVIAAGEVEVVKQKGDKLPPMHQVEDALKYAKVLLSKPDGLSQRVGKTLRGVANKLRAAGKEILDPKDIQEAEAQYRTRLRWIPDKSKMDGLIKKADYAIAGAKNLMSHADLRDKMIGRQWLRAAEELKRHAEFARDNWTKQDLNSAVTAARSELEAEFKRSRDEGAKYPARLGYFPGRWEAEFWNDNTISFGQLRVLGKNYRRPKVFANAYDAIAAGPYIPVNLDAADAVAHRVRQGRMTALNGQWAETLKGIKDPESGEPILVEPDINPIDKQPQAPNHGQDHDLIDIGGRKYAVRLDYKRMVQNASQLRSDLADSPVGKAALALTRRMKHEAILIWDTFHPGRLGQYTAALNGNIKYAGPWSALEYRPLDLANAVKRGLVPAEHARWATDPVKVNAGGQEITTTRRDILMDGIKMGLNVAKLQDALYSEMKHLIPGVTALNKLVFGKVTRGFMSDTFVRNFLKYNAAHPDLPIKTLMRDVIKDTNLFYGSIGRQGIFKKAIFRDLSEFAFLAPTWVEGLVQKEARFASRTTGLSYALGRRELPWQGTLGSGMARGLAMYFVLTQALNMITRGQTTFQNKEKGHKLDAWIPYNLSGREGDGFWLSPLSVFAEVTHDFMRLAETKPKASDAIWQIGYNKLSPWGRVAMVFATRETPTGERLTTSGGVAREMAMQAVPVPITASSLLRYPAHALFPKAIRPVQPGRMAQQFMASAAGIKVQPGETLTTQISRLAGDFMRENKYKVDTVEVVPTDEASYSKLWSAIRMDDDRGAAAFLDELRKRRPDADALIFRAAEARSRRPFTGSWEHEADFQQSLNPEQLKMYDQANTDRMLEFQKFADWFEKHSNLP
jgi:hypothetical protein